jgi:predicted DNA-binding transcriptional regulator YafY
MDGRMGTTRARIHETRAAMRVIPTRVRSTRARVRRTDARVRDNHATLRWARVRFDATRGRVQRARSDFGDVTAGLTPVHHRVRLAEPGKRATQGRAYHLAVGQRSQTETLVAVYQAFLQRRTWKQVELAREVGIGTEPLRRVLYELQAKGMPLDREEERRQEVYWSVPKNWFPGSILFTSQEVPELLRQLRRVPAGQGRKRILDVVLARLPASAATAPTAVVVARESSEKEEQYLSVVEDSASQGLALFMRYFTASRGDAGERHVSVHRVLVGPPARFIGTCHRSKTFKTFRVDSIMSARLDAQEPYRAADDPSIDAYQKASLDGFNDGGTPAAFSFLVRNPEARWVKNNLLDGMKLEELADGMRVTAHTTALGRLARFVVSLGAAATPETLALAREVTVLARGALSVAPVEPSDIPADSDAAEQLRSRV